jgi:hypothetical protein
MQRTQLHSSTESGQDRQDAVIRRRGPRVAGWADAIAAAGKQSSTLLMLMRKPVLCAWTKMAAESGRTTGPCRPATHTLEQVKHTAVAVHARAPAAAAQASNRCLACLAHPAAPLLTPDGR